METVVKSIHNVGSNISWSHFGFWSNFKVYVGFVFPPKQVSTIMVSSSEDDKPARRHVMFVRAGLQRHRDMRTSFCVGTRNIIPTRAIATGLRLSKPVYMCAKDTVSKIALGPQLDLGALQGDTYYVHGSPVSSSESQSCESDDPVDDGEVKCTKYEKEIWNEIYDWFAHDRLWPSRTEDKTRKINFIHHRTKDYAYQKVSEGSGDLYFRSKKEGNKYVVP